MHRERLQHLIETLLEVAKRDKQQKHSHFNMWNWVRTEWDQNDEPIINCGTVACALGWETLTPYANEQGLTYKYGEPCFENSFGFRAGAYYFQITYFQSKYLFDPSRYENIDIRPEDIIQRVLRLLNTGDI